MPPGDQGLPPTVLPRTALPSDSSAPRTARRHVADLCRSWPRPVMDVAQLLTSELVTNAVRHGGGGVTLEVRANEALVRVEVSDEGPDLPPPTPVPMPSGAVDSGRGLALLSSLADAWGTTPQPSSPGKIIWFELHRATTRVPGLSE